MTSPVPVPDLRRMQQAILQACAARGPRKSLCPSEIARQLDPVHWRGLMAPLRAAATGLVAQGLLRVTRRGLDVAPEAPGGPVRFWAPGPHDADPR